MEENTPAADAVRLSLEHGFSRLPVYRKSLDDIVGILYVKDLFALWDTPEKAQAPVSRFMRGAMFEMCIRDSRRSSRRSWTAYPWARWW